MSNIATLVKPDEQTIYCSENTQIAARVLEQEALAVNALQTVLNKDFDRCIEDLLNLKGHVIVSGMGKSGHIANKVAATLSSTGTPAFFVHPGEAGHGDLGMISQNDYVILLSNSGNSNELNPIIHYCKRFSIPLVAIVGTENSFLGKQADISFVLPPFKEATQLISAPTTSTTMMLAFGDAIAVTLMEKRGFTPEDFSLFHPGGQIGAQLQKVEMLMHTEDNLPMVHYKTLMTDVLITMTSKHFGCVAVTDDDGTLIGIITDGDLRRHMNDHFLSLTASAIMTKNPQVIDKNQLASKALHIMSTHAITSLFITDDAHKPIGILHLHDCIRSGVA